MNRLWQGAVLAGWLASCNSTLGLGEVSRTDEWRQAPSDAVDILFIIDNSNSMLEEQKLLADNFKSFVAQLQESAVDFQIGVVSTDMEPHNPERGRLLCAPPILSQQTDYERIFPLCARMGVDGSGRERGFEAAWTAVSPQMTMLGGPNDGFIRAGANLLIVAVSDEDDCSDEGRLGKNPTNDDCYQSYDHLIPVSEYVQRFRDLKGEGGGDFTFAGIVGPENPDAICQQNSIPGRRYIDAARLTNGLTASICDADWGPILSQLGVEAVGIYTDFPMSCGAKGDSLVVSVDDVEIDPDPIDGYTYNPDGPSITFHGKSIPARDSVVVARYTVQSGTCRTVLTR